MLTTRRKNRFYQIAYLLLLSATAVYLTLSTDLFSLSEEMRRDKHIVDFSGGWRADGGRVLPTDTLSVEDFGGQVVLSKQLPDTLRRSDSLCFSSRNVEITVRIDEEDVFRYASVKNLTGNGYGTAYHTVNLSPEDEGKTVQVVLASVFGPGRSGGIRGPYICAPTDFQHMIVSERALSGVISMMIIFFGWLAIAIHVGLERGKGLPFNLAALGTAIVLIGMWSLVDTGLLQLLSGCVYFARVLDYTLLHLAAYPLVCFVNSLTWQKKQVYVHAEFALSVLNVVLILALRFLAGMDMHDILPLLYISYLSPFAVCVVIMYDNRRYCRKNHLTQHLRHFYTGTTCLAVGGVLDIVIYLVGQRFSLRGNGGVMRFGLLIFSAEMILQLFHWWTRERVSIERDRFVNRVLQYAMSGEDAEVNIHAVLKYLGTELRADRAYIFEDMHDGTFDNTYEWCRDGVEPEIDNLKGLPYEGAVDAWYREYKRDKQILIYDIEAYRDVSESMYNVLKPQGIRTLVTGPLELNGEYIGFFGVDNPPEESMAYISEIIHLLSYFLSQLILQRDGQNRLMRYSYYDAMTGAKNRRALSELEKNGFEPAASYGFVMCDINGLKRTNDTLGHEEGDRMITDVAGVLIEVFGAKNVYRIGGDEFAACIPLKSAAELDECVARARKLIKEQGRSAALGGVFCDGGCGIAYARAEADARMYKEKKSYYAGKNDRRH